MDTIYLDYNATTPIAPGVARAMTPFLTDHFGNPSSSHPYSAITKTAVETARSQVAALLGCRPQEIIFNSGGTEGNNHALKGVALAGRERGDGDHLIVTAVEHPAVLEVGKWLESQGFRLTILPVDEFGLVDPDALAAAVTPQTLLVSVMLANNEVGTIQPIPQLARIAHEAGALLHSDAAQAVGKIPVNVAELGVDLLTAAGHKLYAPKGVGAIYVRQGVELANLMHGAGQENGRRPGTENVLQIVGLGAACHIAGQEMAQIEAHLRKMRDRLHQGLQETLGAERVKLNGHPQRRLPNTLNLSFRDTAANLILAKIGPHVAASAGAACHADRVEISAVLRAMDVPEEWAKGAIRFSVGRETTVGQIETAVAVVAEAVQQLQKE